MAENKKSFILYCDQKGVWDKLDDEQAGKLIKHIIAYVNDENPTAPDFITELAFEPIKQHLKRDLKKWEKQYEQRVEAGKKSAESRKRNSTTVNERSISSTDNVNGNVNVNVNDTVNVNERESKAPAILEDELWLDSIQHQIKEKNLKEGWAECYTYHSQDPLSKNWEDWQWKQKLLTWLSIKKDDKKTTVKPKWDLA